MLTVTIGPHLSVVAWYRQARRAGWSRRRALAGALEHGGNLVKTLHW